jgi:hypothetical protein
LLKFWRIEPSSEHKIALKLPNALRMLRESLETVEILKYSDWAVRPLFKKYIFSAKFADHELYVHYRE